MDTLAVQLTIPSAGFVEDFHLQVNAPCRAHQLNSRARLTLGAAVCFRLKVMAPLIQTVKS